MQCISCQFENMPGVNACCRCGSSLCLATAVMDIMPPRASRTRKKLRKLLPRSQSFFIARNQFTNGVSLAHAGVHRVAEELQPPSLPPWSLLLRSLVPGWGNFFIGQAARGWLFLGTFIALLVPGLLMMGTFSGSLLLGFAFSVHTAAATDVINQSLPRDAVRAQIGRSFLITLVIAAFLWLPGDLLLNRVAGVRRIETFSGVFAGGDVLRVFNAYRRADWPKPGMVVLYNISSSRHLLNTHTHTRYYIETDGERVDRILANAGDRVEWQQGQLRVNGQLSPFQPMNGSLVPQTFRGVVPNGNVMILPSTSPQIREFNGDEVASLSMIPIDDISGRVWFRSQPFSRMGWID